MTSISDPVSEVAPAANALEATSADAVIKADDICYPLTSATLCAADAVAELHRLLDATTTLVIMFSAGLLNWPSECRRTLFSIAAKYSELLHTSDSQSDPHAMLDLVLGLMPSASDVTGAAAAERAAIETAAMMYPPEAVGVAAERIYSRMKATGRNGTGPATIRKEILKVIAAEQARSDEDMNAGAGHLLSDIMADVPAPEGYRIPPRFHVSLAGIVDPGGRTVSPVPVVIIARLIDLATGEHSLALAWLSGHEWSSRVFPRSTLLTRDIATLAAFDFPVTSNTAPAMIDYLVASETHNRDLLPIRRTTSQMGWQGPDGRDGFLWGSSLIGASSGSQAIELATEDPSIRQLASGYVASGTLDGWQRAAALAAPHDWMMLGVYASLSPPLLSILGAPNLVLHFSGATSTGKSITQQLAASCWGCPDRNSSRSTMLSAHGTRVYFDRLMAALSGHPLNVDDTSGAIDERQSQQRIYDAASGRGRGRGTPQGTQLTATFATVLIQSGERSLASEVMLGGAMARTIECTGSPLGGASNRNSQTANAIQATVCGHYGHAGPRLVDFLVTQRERWGELRESYAQWVEYFRGLAGDNAAACRKAHAMALLRVTESIAQSIGLVPAAIESAIDRLWPEIVNSTVQADLAAEALRALANYLVQHRNEVLGANLFLGSAQTQFVGVLRDPSSPDFGARRNLPPFIGVLSQELESILGGRFDVSAIRLEWLNRGWLLHSRGRTDYQVRLSEDGGPGRKCYLVAIRWEVFAQVTSADDGEEVTS